MSDILERAESLLEISNCSARAEEFRKSAADLLPELVAECKRLEEVLVGITRGIEDARYECRRAMAEAARLQAAFQPGDERCLKAVIGLVRGVLGPETVSDELSCLLRLQKAALGCQPRVWRMSEERIDALEVMGNLRTEILCPECGAWMGIGDMTPYTPYMAVLRAMLEEAGVDDDYEDCPMVTPRGQRPL